MTTGWSRRTWLSALLALPGAAMARRAVAALRPARLDTEAARTLSAVIDRLLPGDGLPGALDLGIDKRLLADAEMRPALAKGIAMLDAQARRAGAAGFLALDETGQIAAMTAAWAQADSAAEQMLSSLWYRCATLYYAEPAVQQSFAYAGAPQPLGFADFRQAPR